MNIICEDKKNINIMNSVVKTCFVGISLGSSASAETGIAVIDNDFNLVRIDKAFNITDLSAYMNNLGPLKDMVVCVDLPKNMPSFNSKWKYGERNVRAFKLNQNKDSSDMHNSWSDRFSERGNEFCKNLRDSNADVYRYYCYYTKNILRLTSPYKYRSSVECKFLQTAIHNKLKINNIPSNLLPISGLDALIGAYTALRISKTQENIGYKIIGDFKDFSIASALEIPN
jgi:hypothetical protein